MLKWLFKRKAAQQEADAEAIGTMVPVSPLRDSEQSRAEAREEPAAPIPQYGGESRPVRRYGLPRLSDLARPARVMPDPRLRSVKSPAIAVVR